MSRVSPEFIPDMNEQRASELSKLLREKQLAYLQAARGKDLALAEKLRREKDNLLTELRMINPDIDLTMDEYDLDAEAKFETRSHQKNLNDESKIN